MKKKDKKSPEYFGVKFLQKLFPNTRWKKTCLCIIWMEEYFAAIDGIYDEENDVFYLTTRTIY